MPARARAVLRGCVAGAACAQTLVYPQMHRFILHPCVSGGTQRAGCGAFFASTAVLRFESFFTQKKVVVSFTFEVGFSLLQSAPHKLE